MTTPSAVIIDLDGTVALHQLPDGRLIRDHHNYRAVPWDLPNQPVIEVVQALRDSGNQMIFCSARPIRDETGYDVGRATYAWLAENVGEWALTCPLFMRRAGDQRPDDLVKSEIFERFIRPQWNVGLALDDRDRVVALWRSLGITCLQVADGDF